MEANSKQLPIPLYKPFFPLSFASKNDQSTKYIPTSSKEPKAPGKFYHKAEPNPPLPVLSMICNRSTMK